MFALQGTGGVLAKNQVLEPGAIAVGCQAGSAVVISPGSSEAESAPTVKPFGRSQYDPSTKLGYHLPSVLGWAFILWTIRAAEGVFARSRMVVTW